MQKSQDISVAVPIINYRLQMAERYGASRISILRKSGISPEHLDDPSGRVPLEDERTLWREMVSQTRREDLGLICGLNFPIQATGLIGYVMMNSPTIGIAFKKMCVYQKLIGDSMGMRIEEDADYFIVYVDLWTNWNDELRFTMDIVMGACLSWAEKNTVNAIRPIRVGFMYQAPENEQVYRESFAPAPIEFGAEKSFLVYYRRHAESAILTQNSEMLDFFEHQIQAAYSKFEGTETVSNKVKQIIQTNMKGETPSIEQVAMELALSVRSLQRALKAEENSYQQLLQDVRKDLAISYLKNGTFNKSEIAFLLGFSELAVFSRNFKKWTGFTPSNFPIQSA